MAERNKEALLEVSLLPLALPSRPQTVSQHLMKTEGLQTLLKEKHFTISACFLVEKTAVLLVTANIVL